MMKKYLRQLMFGPPWQGPDFRYKLVIARFREQYDQYFPSFSANEITAKHEKRARY